MQLPRAILAADRSGAGKTTVTAAVLKRLTKKYKVRGFKAGPDYIDPGYHRLATGVPSVNLDLWLMGENGVIESLANYGKGFDFGVIEGVMGLYDGAGERFSTYELSRITETPIILILDVSGMSTTAGAVVKGLIDYRGAKIKGVIFNKVGSERHYLECLNSLPKGVRSLGYIPRNDRLKVKERHLGLTTVEDNREAQEVIRIAEESMVLDMEELMSLGEDSGELPEPEQTDEPGHVEGLKSEVAAIAYDSAFSFYYVQNIDSIGRKYKLKFFSPLNDETVEGVDFIYLGGGYPELHLEELERASRTREWIMKSVEDGVKVLGECGGLMFLGRSMSRDGRNYRMVGALDLDVETRGRLTIGYTELESLSDNLVAESGRLARGHEFHVSKVINYEGKPVFRNRIGKGLGDGYDGLMTQNALGTYSHFNFVRKPKFLS
jgi:cobyrinic acid a,c-diamide synthase